MAPVTVTPAITVDIPEFVAEALCAQVDPELFHPEWGEPACEARRICGLCPARVECLRYALDNGERHGIWGGTTPDERRRIRAHRSRGEAA